MHALGPDSKAGHMLRPVTSWQQLKTYLPKVLFEECLKACAGKRT